MVRFFLERFGICVVVLESVEPGDFDLLFPSTLLAVDDRPWRWSLAKHLQEMLRDRSSMSPGFWDLDALTISRVLFDILGRKGVYCYATC